MDNNTEEKIISGGAHYLLMAVAVAADILQAFLGFMVIGVAINTFVTFFIVLIFFVMFLLISPSILLNGWNILYFLAAIFGESIPVVNMAPGWFLAIRKIIENTNQTQIREGEVIPNNTEENNPNLSQ